MLIHLQRLEIPPSHALIVENAPLGVQAANNARIKCIVILNSSPLLCANFEGIIKSKNIFTDNGKYYVERMVCLQSLKKVDNFKILTNEIGETFSKALGIT